MTAVAEVTDEITNTGSDEIAATLVTVHSLVLGLVNVPEASLFHFPAGLHGFESHDRFALVPAAREGLYWLQSTSDPNVVFLLVDPFIASPGFEVDLGVTERSSLDLNDPMDVLVFAIVTIPVGKEDSPTANFRGPIVLNARKRIARQIVSSMRGHEVQTPINLHALPARVDR